MLTQKTNALLDMMISEMAEALLAAGVDLGDERQVLRALVAGGFSEGDAVTLCDSAIASAKAKQNGRTT